jgi:uncharacterized protein YbjT (DUF2867 family)
MPTQFLVTGGTGTLGRLLTPALRDAGGKVRVLSRRAQPSEEDVEFVTGDLSTGDGIDAAVDGAETIVHCAGGPRGDDIKARNLVAAASKVGNPHLVFISVVGAERIPVTSPIDRALFGYFASKRAAEVVVSESGLPWTTLRATQFHDLVLTMAQALAKAPVMPVFAGTRFQPIDTGEVASRLVELALGSPGGLVQDIAGPHIATMKELMQSYLRASARHRPMVSIRLPGKAARAVREGAVLSPEHAVGKRTWEDFLAEKFR